MSEKVNLREYVIKKLPGMARESQQDAENEAIKDARLIKASILENRFFLDDDRLIVVTCILDRAIPFYLRKWKTIYQNQLRAELGRMELSLDRITTTNYITKFGKKVSKLYVWILVPEF